MLDGRSQHQRKSVGNGRQAKKKRLNNDLSPRTNWSLQVSVFSMAHLHRYGLDFLCVIQSRQLARSTGVL